MPPCLYFVVPCYNDADVLPQSAPVFEEKLRALIGGGAVSADSRLLLVNDGSADRTWETILALKKRYPALIALDLAANTGEQNALLAGMGYAQSRADCIITMDSDLQDDINAVDDMLKAFSSGAEIVYGVKNNRKSDGLLQRIGAGLFYGLMRLCGTGLIPEHANYRLCSRAAAEALRERYDPSLYLPCVASGLGLPGAVVYYTRLPRQAGTSAYTFFRRARLAAGALRAHARTPFPRRRGVKEKKEPFYEIKTVLE